MCATILNAELFHHQQLHARIKGFCPEVKLATSVSGQKALTKTPAAGWNYSRALRARSYSESSARDVSLHASDVATSVGIMGGDLASCSACAFVGARGVSQLSKYGPPTLPTSLPGSWLALHTQQARLSECRLLPEQRKTFDMSAGRVLYYCNTTIIL